MLHVKPVFQQQFFHMGVAFVELAVAGADAHAEVVKKGEDPLTAAQFIHGPLQQELSFGRMVRGEVQHTNDLVVYPVGYFSVFIKAESGGAVLHKSMGRLSRMQLGKKLPSITVDVPEHGCAPRLLFDRKMIGGGSRGLP